MSHFVLLKEKYLQLYTKYSFLHSKSTYTSSSTDNNPCYFISNLTPVCLYFHALMWKCIIFLIIYMYFALRSIQILGSIIFLCVCIFYRYIFYSTCILKQKLLILKTSYFWRAQSWMKSKLFYCWGAVQVGSYRTGPPEWRMLGYPPTWPVHPHSCHASSCIPLKKRISRSWN